MKKILVSIAALVLCVVMCFSTLTGCNLITINSERNLEQVVATVQIDKDAPLDKIYKKDMALAFMNYGYMYVQYYGYTQAQTYKMIIDNLVQSRVFVQYAMQAFNKGDAPFENQIADPMENDVWDVTRYLTDDEDIEATYNTIKAVNDLLDSYEDKDEEEKKNDTLTATVRTVPTGATNFEKEVDKPGYITKGIDVDSTAERRLAYTKVIEMLRVNGLLGDEYKGQMTQTDYYQQTLKSNRENLILEKYQKCITDNARSAYTFEDVKKEYASKYNEQKGLSTSEFISKLSSASASDPILCGLNGSYGYVYNLLIGANDIQKAMIEDLSPSLTATERAKARRDILAGTIVTDQRSTWVLSGYDFDGTKFTGDYTFMGENALEFKGDVQKVQEKTKDQNAKYKVTSLDPITLSEFVDMMEMYVYGKKQTAVAGVTDPSVYKKVESNVDVKDYTKKINELLFAFSTDPGSLNTYLGYSIQPKPSSGEAETYMQEFADAGRELLKMGKSSYIMVATDYGYHIMFYSVVLSDTYGYNNLVDYLNSQYGTKNWEDEFNKMLADFDEYEDTDNYMYVLFNSLASSSVSKKLTDNQNSIINKYVYDSNNTYVKLFTGAYADLIIE